MKFQQTSKFCLFLLMLLSKVPAQTISTTPVATVTLVENTTAAIGNTSAINMTTPINSTFLSNTSIPPVTTSTPITTTVFSFMVSNSGYFIESGINLTRCLVDVTADVGCNENAAQPQEVPMGIEMTVVEVINKLDCAVKCLQMEGCEGLQYDPVVNRCLLQVI